MNENVRIGIEFEKVCMDKLISLQFENVEMTKHTDYGADLVAFEDNIKYIFQCKMVKQRQGIKAVQEILGAKSFYNAHKTVVISQSDFTRQAQELAHANLCYLISGNDFLELSSKADFTNMSIDGGLNKHLNFDIIKEFHEAKVKLKKTPTWRELDKTLQYKIRKEYGKYSDFLKLIGIPSFRAKPTEEQLKNEYMRIKKHLKKIPTGEEIKKLSELPFNSFSEYPLTKLQLECGDSPNLQKNVSKEILKEEYLKLKESLGKYPSKIELDKFGIYKYSQYANKWGNLKNFLNYAKIPITDTDVHRNLNEKEVYIIFALIEQILAIKENIPEIKIDTAHLRNLKYKEVELLHKNILAKVGGSVNSFIETKDKKNKYSEFNNELLKLIKKYT